MKVQNVIADYVYIQKLSYSCGPCSILNILHLKDDFSHTEEDLVGICSAKPNIGTSNEDMLKACKHMGLEIVDTNQDAELRDIENNIDKGAYVIVNYYDSFTTEGHYSTITDYDERAFYFVDSSFGLLRFLKEDFLDHWHNSKNTIRGWYIAIK